MARTANSSRPAQFAALRLDGSAPPEWQAHDRGAVAGVARRPSDAGADRRHAGIEPWPRSGVHILKQWDGLLMVRVSAEREVAASPRLAFSVN